MQTLGSGHVAIVVAETDKLNRMTQTAVERLGARLKSGRAVKAEAARFANRMAAQRSRFRVEVLDVVGIDNPNKERPWDLEPIVIHEGKPILVSHVYSGEAGEYWIVGPADTDGARDATIASCARRIACEAFLCEAMTQAIFAADPETTLSSMSCDPKTNTVGLVGEDVGKVARRLPRWITVDTENSGPDAD
jgi:hypothetical protein